MSIKKPKHVQNNPTSTPHQDTSGKESTNRHVYIEPGAQIDFVKDLREEYKAAQKQSTSHNENQLFWTKIGAGLIFIYALLTGYQACLMRTQFTKDQRPYMIAEPKSPVLTKDWKDHPGTPPIAWDVYWINYGKSPAVSLSICYTFSYSDKAEVLTNSIKEIPNCMSRESQIIARGGIIPPGKDGGMFKTISPHFTFSPEQLTVIEKTDDLIAISGIIEYEDLAGNNYGTTFCGMRFASGAIHDCNPQSNKMK